MKKTMKITLSNKKEYNKYVRMLLERGFIQIGTRLFEDDRGYVRFYISK